MNRIELYLNCRMCAEQKPKTISMREYARISVGKTSEGIMIWCDRHDVEIGHYRMEWPGHYSDCKCNGCGDVSR